MNTRKPWETITIHGISGKQTEHTEIISAAVLSRTTVGRRGRIPVDADPTGHTDVLNWLLGDLFQLLDADETTSNAASAGAYAL
jgi:hypothetical protein